MTRPTDPLVAARQRALRTLARLGVMKAELQRRSLLSTELEGCLHRFMQLRWYDAHRFFFSVEPKEAQEYLRERFRPGSLYSFFSMRQDDTEFENTLVVGLALAFAAKEKARGRGFPAGQAGSFTMQRMIEQIAEEVDEIGDLLRLTDLQPKEG